jgi:hypothetical protein
MTRPCCLCNSNSPCFPTCHSFPILYSMIFTPFHRCRTGWRPVTSRKQQRLNEFENCVACSFEECFKQLSEPQQRCFDQNYI